MLVIPALDLSRGRAVRLVRGDFGSEKSYAETPEEVLSLARRLAGAGARRLHVVDLDRARGSGHNRELVRRLIADSELEVQVAGGVRSLEDAGDWLAAGAVAVVMGTVAVREPERLAGVAARHPGRVLAALDVRGGRNGRPSVSGWREVEELSVPLLLQLWSAIPLSGVVLTSVDRDGTLAGPDLTLLSDTVAASAHPVAYSGGIGSVEDLRAVAAAGAAAVILGKSLLEGTVPVSEALAFSSPR